MQSPPSSSPVQSHLINSKYSPFAGLEVFISSDNGGDGLVAARHLQMYNSVNAIYYPKRNTKELFTQLLTQCVDVGVTILDKLPDDISKQYDLLIDAIFGFSFSGDIKEPFKSIINLMNGVTIPIASIDIPSGWDVDKGNMGKLFTPQMLISLTMPKVCAEGYKGVHYLGGRFIPNSIFAKYGISPPFYEGSNEFIKL